MDLMSAYKKCGELASSHYENFPVAKMVPRKIRSHVAAVYAFARTADDIADEDHDTIAADSPLRVERLNEYVAQLDIALKGGGNLNPKWDWIFLACADTIKKFDIPPSLFKDLVSAIAQDVVKKRYADYAELLDYCRRSANPVGRLVLLLHGFRDDERFEMSDNICTALQLANFWQDMSVDKLKNRIYIPQDCWGALTEEDFFSPMASEAVRSCLCRQVVFTEELFKKGERLPGLLPFPLSLEIRLTLAGGRAILKKIERQKFDTLSARPAISKFDKIKILFSALFSR
ncbi:MAG: squalene synthase HpnC [Opitutales bacterium]|nr:squalene synthase HpnC [Opitutales bacterium]